MKNNKLHFALLLLLALPGLGLTKPSWELELGISAWSFAPYKSALEKRTEGIIGLEAARLISDLFPGLELKNDLLLIESESRGITFFISLWRRLGSGDWSLGLRLEKVAYKVPMRINTEHTVLFLLQPLLPVYTKGRANLTIDSLAPSFSIRWQPTRFNKLFFSGQAGIGYLPLTGRLDYKTDASFTVLDLNLTIPLWLDNTLTDIRRQWSDIPAGIFFPLLEARFGYNFSPVGGICLGLAFSSGISAGFSFFYRF